MAVATARVAVVRAIIAIFAMLFMADLIAAKRHIHALAVLAVIVGVALPAGIATIVGTALFVVTLRDAGTIAILAHRPHTTFAAGPAAAVVAALFSFALWFAMTHPIDTILVRLALTAGPTAAIVPTFLAKARVACADVAHAFLTTGTLRWATAPFKIAAFSFAYGGALSAIEMFGSELDTFVVNAGLVFALRVFPALRWRPLELVGG